MGSILTPRSLSILAMPTPPQKASIAHKKRSASQHATCASMKGPVSVLSISIMCATAVFKDKRFLTAADMERMKQELPILYDDHQQN